MIAEGALFTKQYRLATYYLDKLRSAHTLYQRGSDHMVYALKLLDEEWAQIQQWQGWAASQRQHDAASVANQFPLVGGKLLELMITPEEHRSWCETALQHARSLNDTAAEITHLISLSEIDEKLDRYASATEYAQVALALAQQAGDQTGIAEALSALGLISLRLGKYDEAEKAFRETLGIGRRRKNYQGVANSLMRLGSIMQLRGNRHAAQSYYEEALEIRRNLADGRGIAEALNILGEIMLMENETDRGRQYFDEALSIRRMLGDQQGIAVELTNIGRALVMQGDFAGVKAYIEESLAISQELGSRKGVNSNLLTLAGVAILQRDYMSARTHSETVLEMSRQIGNQVGIVNALVYLAYSQLGLGIIEEARSSLREGLKTLDQLGITLLRTEFITGVALLRLQTGEVEGSGVLVGMVEIHPELHPVTSKYILPFVRRTLIKFLGEEKVAALRATGQQLDFEKTVIAIMQELS